MKAINQLNNNKLLKKIKNKRVKYTVRNKMNKSTKTTTKMVDRVRVVYLHF